MKKLILLLTMICAHQLYGMEPSYESLPPELKQEIINKALAASNTSSEAIQNLKKLSIMHGIEFDKLFNLKDFTKLAHVLADTFEEGDMNVIATLFDTPIAKKYLALATKLLMAIKAENLNTITQCIEDGADVNIVAYDQMKNTITPLQIAALFRSNPEVVQLLLNHGANPYTTAGAYEHRKTVLDWLREFKSTSNESRAIIQMLKEAMQKEQ